MQRRPFTRGGRQLYVVRGGCGRPGRQPWAVRVWQKFGTALGITRPQRKG